VRANANGFNDERAAFCIAVPGEATIVSASTACATAAVAIR
jgi:hypothetical protein